jgi:predicted small lipoprotein YifL
MSRMRATASSIAAVLIGAALAVAMTGGLSGCGLKGSLYLPQQKKTKVPPTTNNEPAPDSSPPP